MASPCYTYTPLIGAAFLKIEQFQKIPDPSKACASPALDGLFLLPG